MTDAQIGLALIAVWYVIAGYIQDHRGPRPVAMIGGFLFSLGFFLASYTTTLTWFYLTAGVIAGTGCRSRHARNSGSPCPQS